MTKALNRNIQINWEEDLEVQTLTNNIYKNILFFMG